MKKRVLTPCVLFLLFTLINSVNAQGDFFTDKFLSSPLIILVAIIVIDIIAFIYHKIRR